MIITIDGPTASGKSTAARYLAKRLGYYYIYSGLLFRALAYVLINEHGYKEDDLRNPRAEDLEHSFGPEHFFYQYNDQFQERVFFNEIDITPHLHSSFIDRSSSILSTNKRVRDRVASVQRDIARDYSVVVDGRDAGSVIFPGADLKFFLTASVAVRAERWRQVQAKHGDDFTIEQAIEQINERDKRDQEREIAPLIIPKDAIIVDNSDLTQQQTLEKMLALVRTNLAM